MGLGNELLNASTYPLQYALVPRGVRVPLVGKHWSKSVILTCSHPGTRIFILMQSHDGFQKFEGQSSIYILSIYFRISNQMLRGPNWGCADC